MCGKKNLTEKALQLYEQMKLSRRFPDTITFTVLIDGFGKAGLVKEAERIFTEMKTSKCQSVSKHLHCDGLHWSGQQSVAHNLKHAEERAGIGQRALLLQLYQKERLSAEADGLCEDMFKGGYEH
ncbi:hypothetical protein R1sor_013963 [Riccia sorocarpa]|uniref:Pentatricopeptide repeat-containing protein n=1 Tax=Riccia sorocarpa TaxID=122646 RepID=A0ABD3HBX1_9MARC